MPNTPAIRPYFDAVKDLLKQYDTNEFNPEKGAKLLEGKGYAKGADGMWAKGGEKITLPINGWAVFSDIGPVV